MLAHMSAAAREPEREREPEPKPEPKPGWTPSGGAGLHAAVRQVCTANPKIGIKALVFEVKQQFPGKESRFQQLRALETPAPGLVLPSWHASN